MPGFIHDELDVKLLILYIVCRAAGPVDFATLTDLAMCDGGVDYFVFSQSVADLVANGNLSLEDGLYTATAKGRENSATLESSLPIVIRGRCDKALLTLNAAIRRAAQVTARVEEEGSRKMAVLGLDDDAGPLLDMTFTAPTVEMAQRITKNFQAHPEVIYERLLALLLNPPEGEASGEDG